MNLMKTSAFIFFMAGLNRALLWLFPNSDAVWNYALMPIGLIGAIVIVVSEMKSNTVPIE